MFDWKQRAMELQMNDVCYRDIATALTAELGEEYTYDKVQKFFQRKGFEAKTFGKPYNPDAEKPYVESFSVGSDGVSVSDKLIEIMDNVAITPEMIVELHGLDPLKWEVVAYRNNLWHSKSKTQDHVVMYQSRLSVRPSKIGVSISQIDSYFSEKKYDSFVPKTLRKQYSSDGEVLEIDLPDLHSGLLSWNQETGEDYDLHIVKDRFYSCIKDIIDRCAMRTFSKIVFVTLGDLLHIDNDDQKTTKGTQQQADGRIAKIFDSTLDMLITAFVMLGDIAPLEVIYVSGNHDRVSGYMLIKACEMAFMHDNNVTFDCSPDPQKHRVFGDTLVGLTHGDMSAKNMAGWLQHRARKEFGLTNHAEIHCGHLHTPGTKEVRKSDISDTDQLVDIDGIIIRHLPTICSSSYWEHQQGYTGSEKAVVSFVWSMYNGLREVWHSVV